MAFDFYDIAGVRFFMEAIDLDKPRVWFHIFNEQGPTEMLQWLFLGLITLASIFTSGQLLEHNNHRLGYFWFLIGILTLILLMEDGANVSHRFNQYMGYISPETLLNSRAIVYLMYIIIALIPIVKYWKDFYYYKLSFKYLISGYLVYGFAGFFSVFLGVLGISRAPIGNFIINNLHGGILNYADPLYLNEDVGEIFMDTVVEESIELFAVCLIFSSIVSFVQSYNDNMENYDSIN